MTLPSVALLRITESQSKELQRLTSATVFKSFLTLEHILKSKFPTWVPICKILKIELMD